MSSFSINARSPRTLSPLYDINHYQLNLILQKATPRADLFHKMVHFINITGLDGKAFMGLSDKKLAELASHDPRIIDLCQGLRKAHSQYIHSLLASGRERSPELTTLTEEHPFDNEGSRDEKSVDPISNSGVQSRLGVGDVHADTQNLIPDTMISPGAQDIQTSTDAAHHDRNGSSQSPQPTTFNPEPDELPPGLEPAGDALGPSPIDPITVSLPPSDDSELDFLNPQDIPHVEAYSEEDPVSSELESDGLSTNAGSIIDDESQASSVVAHQDAGDAHVSVEVEVQAQELHGGSSLSPLDVIPDSLIEDPSVVTGEFSNPTGDGGPTGTNLLDTEPTQSLPADQANPCDDQTISAHTDVSDSDGRNLKDNEVEPSDKRGSVLPAPAEDDGLQQGVSREDPPTPTNLSEPEVSGDMQEAKQSQNSTTTHGSGQSSSDGVSEPPHVVSTPGEASVPPSEIVASGWKEHEQLNAISITDEPPATILATQSETTHPSGNVSPEVPAEGMANELSEDKTVAIQSSNPEETDPERNPPSDSERLPSPLSNSMAHDSSEAHENIAGDSAGPEFRYSAQGTEELGPITFITANSAPNGYIPITYEESPSMISIEYDVSPTASPAPSSLSVFSDSATKAFPEFYFLPPVSPSLDLKDGNVLLLCEGFEDYHHFLTSTPTDAIQTPPFLLRTGVNINDDDQDANEPRLFDHPFSSRDDSTLDQLDSEDHFNVSSLGDQMIDEPVPEIPVEGAPASLLDNQRPEPTDPASDLCSTVPDVTLNSVQSDIDEGHDTDVSNNNQVEASVLTADANQQVSKEANSDEPSTETGDAPTLHALRFRQLPAINTNIPPLMLDPEISVFLSPNDCSTQNRIVRASSLPTPSRSSSASSDRTLFPRSGSCTSDKTIAEYTKRLRDSREAKDGAVGRSFFCDVATQTESAENQHRLETLQVETSTLGSVASTLVSPLSSVLTSAFSWL